MSETLEASNQSFKNLSNKVLVLFCLIKYIYSCNRTRSGCEAVPLNKNYVNQALV